MTKKRSKAKAKRKKKKKKRITKAAGPTPREFLFTAIRGVMQVRALGVAAEFGIADLVAEAPRSVDELAQDVGCHRDSLYRLLRTLAGKGVFAENADGLIELTDRAELLRSDHPDSMREYFMLEWQDTLWSGYLALPEAIRTGEVAFELATGSGFFDYLQANPALAETFNRRMADMSHAENEPIVAAYPFSEAGSVIDIGGGRGGLLATILDRSPELTAALFEQPDVLANLESLSALGLPEQVARIAGDFFAEVPAGFDLYMLKRVIHDWDDEQAIKILRCCREAMTADSRILLMDAVMLAGNEPDPNKDMDLDIMLLTPGRERTEAEFRELFTAAGLELKQIISTAQPSTISLLEGVVATA